MGYVICIPLGILVFLGVGRAVSPSIGFFLGGFICFLPLLISSEAKKKEFLETRVKEIVSKHVQTLSLKWDQGVTSDEYGNVITDDFDRSLDYFIKTVLSTDKDVQAIMSNDKNYAVMARNLVLDEIAAFKDKQAVDGVQRINIDLLDPTQYEHHCAELLRNSGWDARVTKASGDQGIDVIANYGNVKAVLQCKKYSQPVGNAAVQEIIAGKQFEQAHIAAVVSNAPYTPSAKQLANAANVYLLHHDELPGFADRIGPVESS